MAAKFRQMTWLLRGVAGLGERPSGSALELLRLRLDLDGAGLSAGGDGGGDGVCFVLGRCCVRRAATCFHRVTSPQAAPAKTASARTKLPDLFAEGC